MTKANERECRQRGKEGQGLAAKDKNLGKYDSKYTFKTLKNPDSVIVANYSRTL